MSAPARHLTRAAACVAAVAGLALPASAAAGGDRARDFTQPLPEARQVGEPTVHQMRAAERRRGVGIEGRVLYRTRTIEAPASFDLVGVAGETGLLEFRGRREGRPWGGWVEADNGDPAYTGDADEVQVRSRWSPIEGELHYVSLPEPLARTPQSAASDRRAGVPKPKFVGRAAWGANAKQGGCLPRETPTRGRTKAAVVHHTVTANDYSEAEAPGIVLGICRYHRNANGWNDIGYNALVDRFGNLYQGRAGGMNRSIVGAQAEGHNLQTTGVASIGDHRTEAPTGPAKRAIVRYLAWKLDLVGLDATGRTWLTSSGGQTTRTPDGERIRVNRILSHSDVNFTECAGTRLRAKLPAIRRAVQARIDEYGGGEPTEDPVEPGGGGSSP